MQKTRDEIARLRALSPKQAAARVEARHATAEAARVAAEAAKIAAAERARKLHSESRRLVDTA